MKYNEIKISVDRENLDAVETILIENGFVSLQIDDVDDLREIVENPEKYKYDYINEELTDILAEDSERRPSITLYFAEDAEGQRDQERAVALLESLAGVHKGFSIEEKGDDSEWLYKWQEFFKPTKIGKRIVVKPSWENYEAGEGELVIEMDPGMAFGSGLHETSSMCIKALEGILTGADSDRDIRILDVGCGTGILAIAGALLGASECLGIDIDPDAVSVANENIRINKLEDKVAAQYGNLTEGVDYKAEIIVANLMADLVIKLSPSAREHITENGYYISSGILDIKEELVSKAIEESGFDIIEVLHDGEWCAIIAKAKPLE